MLDGARQYARRGRTRLGVLALTLCWVLAAQGGIYRWTDADGRTHFGDRPPATVKKDAENLSNTYEEHIPFTFEIIPVDYAMPHDTRGKVDVAVAKIHEIYRSRLGLGFDTDPSFDIRIFKNQKGFLGYGEGASLGGLASGYYSHARNEAVTWRQHSFDQMLEVITHEANHALLHHRFGTTPPWLNEGLSEYFERMEVFGKAVVIHPHPEWDRLVKGKIRADSITPLADYMALSHRDWQIHNLPDNGSYAQAWSLIHFLMSSPEGTKLLGHLLRTLAQVGTEDFSAVDVIEANHDGGMAALQTQWRSWALGPKQAHHY